MNFISLCTILFCCTYCFSYWLIQCVSPSSNSTYDQGKSEGWEWFFFLTWESRSQSSQRVIQTLPHSQDGKQNERISSKCVISCPKPNPGAYRPLKARKKVLELSLASLPPIWFYLSDGCGFALALILPNVADPALIKTCLLQNTGGIRADVINCKCWWLNHWSLNTT